MKTDVRGIVKYSNDMYGLKFPTKNIHEEALVMWTLKRLQNKGPEEITLNYDEIRDVAQFSPITSAADIEKFTNEFIDNTANMRVDMKIAARLGSDEYLRIALPLYNLAALSTDERVFRLSLNDQFLYLVNNVEKNFTALEYSDYFEKSTPSSKRLFTLLSRYKYLGTYEWRVDDLRSILDCAESYSVSQFYSVHIAPSIKELKKDFPGLKVEKIKVGRKIVKLKFTWDKKYQEEKKDTEILDHQVNKLMKEAEKITEGNKKVAKTRKTKDKLITKYISENIEKLKVPNDFDWQNTYIATPDEIRAKFEAVELLSFLNSRAEAHGMQKVHPLARENFSDEDWQAVLDSFQN